MGVWNRSIRPSNGIGSGVQARSGLLGTSLAISLRGTFRALPAFPGNVDLLQKNRSQGADWRLNGLDRMAGNESIHLHIVIASFNPIRIQQQLLLFTVSRHHSIFVAR
jgi:hypothetical protein